MSEKSNNNGETANNKAKLLLHSASIANSETTEVDYHYYYCNEIRQHSLNMILDFRSVVYN